MGATSQLMELKHREEERIAFLQKEIEAEMQALLTSSGNLNAWLLAVTENQNTELAWSAPLPIFISILTTTCEDSRSIVTHCQPVTITPYAQAHTHLSQPPTHFFYQKKRGIYNNKCRLWTFCS